MSKFKVCANYIALSGANYTYMYTCTHTCTRGRYIGVPTSSAAVERLFCIADKVFSPERCRLTDSRFKQLMVNSQDRSSDSRVCNIEIVWAILSAIVHATWSYKTTSIDNGRRVSASHSAYKLLKNTCTIQLYYKMCNNNIMYSIQHGNIVLLCILQ